MSIIEHRAKVIKEDNNKTRPKTDMRCYNSWSEGAYTTVQRPLGVTQRRADGII